MALAPWACLSVGLRPANKVLTGKTSTKGISSIKPEMEILINYSYSVIDVRT